MTHEQIAVLGTVLVGFGGVSASVTESMGRLAFIRRWLVGMSIAGALLVGGVLLGTIMYSALCAGPWICTAPPW